MTLPWHDPEFPTQVVNFILEHREEWCHPQDLWPADDEWDRSAIREGVHEAVEIARRCGMVIESDREKGYRFLFWDRRQAFYMHRGVVMEWPPPDQPAWGRERHEPCEGQLQIACA